MCSALYVNVKQARACCKHTQRAYCEFVKIEQSSAAAMSASETYHKPHTTPAGQKSKQQQPEDSCPHFPTHSIGVD